MGRQQVATAHYAISVCNMPNNMQMDNQQVDILLCIRMQLIRTATGYGDIYCQIHVDSYQV